MNGDISPPAFERGGVSVIAILGGAILVAALFSADSIWNIDEFVYYAGAKSMWDHGSFAFENGYQQLPFEGIRLWLFIWGPSGLVPQYPIGTAVLGAPLVGLFDTRGLIILNAVSAVATLFVTRALALQLFKDKSVALVSVLLLAGATFWLEYAFTILPHSTSLLFTTLAFYFGFRAVEEEREFRPALYSGLAVGMAFLVRTDSIIALAALGFVLALWARHPVRALIALGLGTLPAMAIASWANLQKFGDWNPLSYGKTAGGNTSLSEHLPAIAVVVVAFLLLLVARSAKRRPPVRPLLLAGGAIVVAAIALIEPVRAAFFAYVKGAYALFIDSRELAGQRGTVIGPGGAIYFWGATKKALVQSAPWLGILGLVVGASWRVQNTRATLLVLLGFFIWTLPFCLLIWPGGPGSNMRYFIPVLPLLAALSGALIVDLARKTSNWHRLLAIGFLMAIAITFLAARIHPAGLAGAQQDWSRFVFLAIAMLAAMAGLRKFDIAPVRKSLMVVLGTGLGMGAMFGALDLQRDQATRFQYADYSEGLASLPNRAIYIGHPNFLYKWLFKPGHFGALYEFELKIDPDLVNAALQHDLRVFLTPYRVKDGLPSGYEWEIEPSGYRHPAGEIYEILSISKTVEEPAPDAS